METLLETKQAKITSELFPTEEMTLTINGEPHVFPPGHRNEISLWVRGMKVLFVNYAQNTEEDYANVPFYIGMLIKFLDTTTKELKEANALIQDIQTTP